MPEPRLGCCVLCAITTEHSHPADPPTLPRLSELSQPPADGGGA